MKEIEKALDLCIRAIEALHPILDPNEPCIAFEAWSLAKKVLESIETSSQSTKQPIEDRTATCPFCDKTVENWEFYCQACGKMFEGPPST